MTRHKPIVVPKSATWDVIWHTLRSLGLVASGALVVIVYRTEGLGSAIGAGAMLISALPAIGAYAAGWIKWVRTNRERRAMADHLPDRIAQVKS